LWSYRQASILSHVQSADLHEQTREWIEDLAFLRRSNVLYLSEKIARNNPYNLVVENKNLKEKLKKGND